MGEQLKLAKAAPKHKPVSDRTSFIHRKGEPVFFAGGQAAVSTTPLFIQPKLKVSQPGDPFEQEADRFADNVMRMQDPAPAMPDENAADDDIQRKCSKCEEEEKLQRKAMAPRTGCSTCDEAQVQPKMEEADEDTFAGATGTFQRQAIVHRKVDRQDAEEQDDAIFPKRNLSTTHLRGPPLPSAAFQQNLLARKGTGRPMDNPTREFMESRFNADFSGVKVHTDAHAAELSRAINARAFTHGKDIYFNSGQYNPETGTGRHLLAHELTHVLQQRTMPVSKIKRKAGDPALEKSVCDVGGAVATPDAEKSAGKLPGSDQAVSETAVPLPPPGPGEPTEAPASIGVAPVEAAPPSKITARDIAGKDPAFGEVVNDARHAARRQKKHDGPEAKAKEAEQSSEVKEGADETAQTLGARVLTVDEKIKTEPEKPFTADAFKKALRERIASQFPNNKGEYKDFQKTNSIATLKTTTSQEIGEAQDHVVSTAATISSETAVDSRKKAEIFNQETIPAATEHEGPRPAIAHTARAIPKPLPDSDLQLDKAHDADSLDKLMKENDMTDNQLSASEEPSFIETLQVKQDSQQQLCAMPSKMRAEEAKQSKKDAVHAAGTFHGAMGAMNDTRKGAFGEIQLGKDHLKTADEKLLADYYLTIKNTFECTERRVNKKLDDLETTVGDIFQAAVDKAYETFKENVSERLDDYYGADLLVVTVSNEDEESDDEARSENASIDWQITKLIMSTGPLHPDDPARKRIEQKIVSLQAQKRKLIIDRIFEEEKNLFISSLDTAIDQIAQLVATGLNDAKKMIEQGKAAIECETAKLPQDLQQKAKETADDFLERFDDLKEIVNEKQADLIDTIAKQYTESVDKLKQTFEDIRAEEAMSIWEKAWRKIKEIATIIYNLGKLLLDILVKAAGVVGDILAHPIRFFDNLIEGVSLGFRNFITNLPKHLEDIIFKLILGVVPPGLTFPDKWDEKGILGFVLGIFGLSSENIRKQAVDRFGAPIVEKLEQGFELFIIFKNEGFAGLWHHIRDKIGDLKERIIGEVKSYFKEAIIQAAVEFLLSALTPASGFIKVCKTIINIVMFFIKNLQNILKLLDAILDSLVDIAQGRVGNAAKKVENALADILLIGIKFLAALVGINLNKIQEKVSRIINKVRTPVNRAIKWLFDKATAFARKTGLLKLARKGQRKIAAGKRAAERKVAQAKEKAKKVKERIIEWWKTKKPVHVDGEAHTMYFEGTGETATLMMRSKAVTYRKFVSDLKIPADQKKEILDLAGQIDAKLKQYGRIAQEDRKKWSDDLVVLMNWLAELTEKYASAEVKMPHTVITWGSVTEDTFGTSFNAKLLSDKYVTGEEAKKESKAVYGWDIARGRKTFAESGNVTSVYVKGHLLNDNLGGKANATNLTPITNQANKDHVNQVESHVKKIVTGQAKKTKTSKKGPKGVANYEVVALYDKHPSRTALKEKYFAEIREFATLQGENMKRNDPDSLARVRNLDRAIAVNNELVLLLDYEEHALPTVLLCKWQAMMYDKALKEWVPDPAQPEQVVPVNNELPGAVEAYDLVVHQLNKL